MDTYRSELSQLSAINEYLFEYVQEWGRLLWFTPLDHLLLSPPLRPVCAEEAEIIKAKERCTMRVKCVENSRFSDQNIDGQFITLSAETAIGGPPRSVREFNIQDACLFLAPSSFLSF